MNMSRDDIYDVVLEYLDLVEKGKESAEDNLKALEVVLDKLALARHFIDYKFDETDYPDEPRKNYAHGRELVAKRFPEFGFYHIPNSVTDKVGEAEIMMGDAVDDVADIARDLSAVDWRWKKHSPDDALFHFEILYDGHWGDHLRDLQYYLHYFKNQ